MELLNPSPTLDPGVKTPAGRPNALAFVNDPNSEEVLKTAFRDEAPGTVMRGDIRTAIQHLSETRSPRLLIVDISDVALPVTEVHRLADVCEPGVSVVVIGIRDEVGLYRDLLHAGVADYIVKPLTDNLIARTLHVASGGSEATPISRKLGKVVGCVGARGGVGTSSIAVNLAWHLANRGARRVALVDLDLHNGVCCLMLNIQPTRGLREALENPLRIDALFLERTMAAYSDRLFVLGDEAPIDEELEFPIESIDRLLEVLREQYHYVVADLARLPNPLSQRVFELADAKVIVIDQTFQAIRDAARIVRLPCLDGAHGRTLTVVNRVGEGGRHTAKVEEVAGAIDQRLRSRIPFQPMLFATAAERGTLAVEKRGQFADAIAELGAQLSGQAAQKQSFWRVFR